MKIALIGGHLSPALSVLESLPKEDKVLFVGRKYAFEGDNALSLEYKTITSLNVPFVGLNTGRLQRKLTAHTISSLLKLPLGLLRSFIILVKFRPDVVVGFGGYVSFPVIFSAYLLRVPIVIHEQTLEAGFANKILSKFASKVCISWNSSRKYFPREKIVFTGNPIREPKIDSSIGSGAKLKINKEKNNLPLIYVTGGSSGSHFINVLLEGCVRELLEKYNVIHQTGDAQEFHDFDRLEKIKNNLSPELRQRYILNKFINPSEVSSLLREASLVISRSGMNTITELIYFEKPSLLIPLPYSQNNEQLKNAKFLERLGLGKVLLQNELDSKKLFQAISLMFNNINNYKIDAGERKKLPRQSAAQSIIEVIKYVCQVKKT
ncbi:MAG: UDP-N-acetylglucosamine--N-acetylmuramyl-(pentapeptide) pyrophosphoryl-undecaprenol N-acetylglucosamine transferase [Candidatus Levybacteria bacterium]|nr:UDP-N-acetylglucosamine--N-acetylmuramyl-(pentapeptide) pyrophosphoryl-undecaprenol N-acetylglucosamine transferase [Candidatus Levybacteria bacterium]